MSVNVIDFNPYETNTVPAHQKGALYVDPYGDCWRYAYVGAVAITAGKLQVCPAPKTNHHNIAAAAAAAVGDVKVTVDLGATLAAVGEYNEGFLVANDVAPEGVAYRITSHPAAASDANLEVTLARPLIEAVTTTSEFELLHNNWNGVVDRKSV